MRFDLAFGGLLPGVQGGVLAALLRTGTPLTGRQVHALVRDDFSLWSVQQALAALRKLGLVDAQPVGRAMIHAINEEHHAIQPLRVLLDPLAALKETVRVTVGPDVATVILFGSVARGEVRADSDIDLAVLTTRPWTGRTDLEDAVHTRLGNTCDVLAFTSEEFSRLVGNGEEPVVGEILADGIALLGTLPPAARDRPDGPARPGHGRTRRPGRPSSPVTGPISRRTPLAGQPIGPA
ncbi:MAG: nucleotidyltransferase domain-containing protein [Propionicimonas sp.]|uniref:nucleotidyltransferase domain-containing protein n=1 Tax=Propionicimonas sp. TaxID=1955623 RepID=UPI002B1FDB45|nr:nucleotidyltransferase domain-containing protein [Propionicimonas sp.]MEA4942886.1 nucleotidyltransferase domain-containing protein [Propionicimonas sp.]